MKKANNVFQYLFGILLVIISLGMAIYCTVDGLNTSNVQVRNRDITCFVVSIVVIGIIFFTFNKPDDNSIPPEQNIEKDQLNNKKRVFQDIS